MYACTDINAWLSCVKLSSHSLIAIKIARLQKDEKEEPAKPISMDQNSIYPRHAYHILYHILHYYIHLIRNSIYSQIIFSKYQKNINLFSSQLRLFSLRLYTEQDIQSVVIINRCISLWWSMSFVQRIIERWQVLLEWFPGGQRKMTKCDSKYKKHVTLIKEIENLSFSRIKKLPWRLFERKIMSYSNIVKTIVIAMTYFVN